MFKKIVLILTLGVSYQSLMAEMISAENKHAIKYGVAAGIMGTGVHEAFKNKSGKNWSAPIGFQLDCLVGAAACHASKVEETGTYTLANIITQLLLALAKGKVQECASRLS